MSTKTTKVVEKFIRLVDKKRLKLSPAEWQQLNQELAEIQQLSAQDPTGEDPNISTQISWDIMKAMAAIPIIKRNFPELSSLLNVKPTGIRPRRITPSVKPLLNRLITLTEKETKV